MRVTFFGEKERKGMLVMLIIRLGDVWGDEREGTEDRESGANRRKRREGQRKMVIGR